MSFQQNTKISSYKSIFFTIFGIFLGILWSYLFFYKIAPGEFLKEENNQSASGAISVFSNHKAKEIYALIEQNYLDFNKKTKTEIEDVFLGAVVAGLGDEHSEYFNEEDAKKFHTFLDRDFGGIGVVFEPEVRGIRIMKVLKDSPAEKSGLLRGDIIIRVDGELIDVEKDTDIAKQIQGEPGTKVQLGYLRSDDTLEHSVEVTRDVIHIPSVSATMLDENIGYIEIASFSENTTKEFYDANEQLMHSGAKGIVLDFRDNGGGYLQTAIDLASIFLPKNNIVLRTKETNPLDNQVFYTAPGVIHNYTIPLVVLVNNFSASSSEIVAGALKDMARAIIVGEKTYGKGSIQKQFTLSDGSLVKLTTAKWYTPKNISIADVGITPNITISLTDKDYETQNDRQLKEAQKILLEFLEKKIPLSDFIEQYTPSKEAIKENIDKSEQKSPQQELPQ